MSGDYTLEVQRSLTGISDYAALTAIANVTPGDSISYDDTAVVPGTLYYYRARYFLTADSSIFTAWAYALARAPYPITKGLPMGAVITSARTQLGMGVERTPGQNVQVSHGVDAVSWDFPPPKNIAETQSNRNVVSAVTDEVITATPITGNTTIDVRPDGGTLRTLLAGYKLLSTTTVAASGSVPTYYIHKLVPDFTDTPITICGKEGDYATVLAGAQINTLGLDIDKTQTTPLRAAIAFMARNYLQYDASTSQLLTDLGLSGVVYDTKKIGPTDWVLSIGGVQSPDARKFGYNFNRNLQSKMVADYYAGAQSLYPEKSQVSGTSELFWTDLTAIGQFFGVADSTILPFGVLKNISTNEVRFTAKPPLNTNGYNNTLEVVFPVASIRSITKPVPEQGAIMQNLTFQPRQDPANGLIDHYILWTTSESAAVLATVQPEMPYTPKTELYPYNAVPVTASGTPTTTQTISTTNAFINTTTDSVYVGLYLLATTGAQKGLKRLISAYTASTRTITHAAFPAALAATDKAVIVGGFGL